MAIKICLKSGTKIVEKLDENVLNLAIETIEKNWYQYAMTMSKTIVFVEIEKTKENGYTTIRRDSFFKEHNLELENYSKSNFYLAMNLDAQKKAIFECYYKSKFHKVNYVKGLFKEQSKAFINAIIIKLELF